MQREISYCKKKTIISGIDVGQGVCTDYSDWTFAMFEAETPAIKSWIEQCIFNNFD